MVGKAVTGHLMGYKVPLGNVKEDIESYSSLASLLIFLIDHYLYSEQNPRLGHF
jgi:hypothetical protein